MLASQPGESGSNNSSSSDLVEDAPSMSATDYDACREIANLSDSILGTGIIEDMEIVAMYAKPKVPLPNEERFRQMFIQSQVLVSIVKSNADYFGRVRYLVSSFDSSDVVFFPLARREGGGTGKDKERILVVQILRPCDHEQIAREVMQRIK